MYCSKCGAFNNKGNKFCINCGTQLEVTTSSASKPSEHKTQIPDPSPSPAQEQEQSVNKYLERERNGQPFFELGHMFLDRYELKSLLGRGGMGEVYKAFDREEKKDVAIKMLLPSLLDNEEAVKRFLNEAKIAKQIVHSNIVRSFDSGQFENINYMIMEYVEGITLRQWIDQKFQTSDTEEVLGILFQLCEGIKFAHGYTIHRDIKPENIIITKSGIVKIMDFGIAKMLSISQVTETQTSMGTVYYMAPEQTTGTGVVDERADVFSIGVIFYEMLTGKVPIGVFKIPTSVTKLIIPGMGAILRKALESDPKDRFQTMAEMQEALRQERDAIKKIKIEQKVFAEQKTQPGQAEVITSKDIKFKKASLSKKFSIKAVVISLCVFIAVIGGFLYVGVQTKKIKDFHKPDYNIEAVTVKTTDDLESATEEKEKKSGLAYQMDTKNTGIEMVLIPAGAFFMGSPTDRGDEDEEPLHKVWVDSFYMGKYEVTNQEYKMFIDEFGYEQPVNVFGDDSEYTLWQGKEFPDSIANYPVINVSWYDAVAFCNWLCEKEGVPKGTYRLPTEAEWEKAARGLQEFKYPWGDEGPDNRLLNYNKRWTGATTLKKVGFYEPNDYGLYDMAGNVWEWCMDRYNKDFYSTSLYKNPICITGDQVVLRGGSWSSYAYLVRATNRYANEPDVRYFYNGFRVVRVVK